MLLLITGRYKEQGFTAGTPVRDWLVIALGYLGAHEFGLWALAYIPFPFQVVCKSCKAVPVMFGEKLFDAEKKHTRQKELSVSSLCTWLINFRRSNASLLRVILYI